MKMNRVNAYKWTTMKCIQRIQITNDYIDTNIYITKDWDVINISYIFTELKQINWMYLEQEYII